MALPDRPAMFSMLTTGIQLCLAHYCDLHGPTPLMVTEGLPVPCGRCYDDSSINTIAEVARPRSSATPTPTPTPTPAGSTAAPAAVAVTDALRHMNLATARSSSTTVPAHDAQKHRAALLRSSNLVSKSEAAHSAPAKAPAPALALQTPPQSPRRTGDGFSDARPAANVPRRERDPRFQLTYDEYVTKHASPCANCALTLPKRQDVKAGQAPDSNSKMEAHGPTMRTRAPYARVYGSLADTSPPCSNPQSSYTSDAEEETSPNHATRSNNSHRRPTTSASQSSATSKGSMPHHTHYLDYTSTHEPTVANTYKSVRASCLRTLSFETLPRRPEATQSTPSLLGSPPCIPPALSGMGVGPGYITAPPTPQSAASGGPIFFGDPSTGYTTAYIFRIPDMHARGRKRVYAFLALSTHRERLAMKAFSFISAAFRDLAAWIQELVEVEAERARESEDGGSAVAALNAAYATSGFGGRGPHDSGIGLGRGLGGGRAEISKQREHETSSFLTGGSRSGYMQRMGGSMGPSGFTPKARGLAELVGLPDFFIELHARFVKLLLELGVVLGS
ncbi:vesicle coat protein [Nemania sp. FL0916]|nr:vesicle coat protein [Nemania sp. FL0916]